MRLKKLPDGRVQFSEMNGWEVKTFRSLPAMADFSTDRSAEQRLLPRPAVDGDLTPEMAMDWVEYVVPELRGGFARNLETVAADLDHIRQDDPPLTEEQKKPEETGGGEPGPAGEEPGNGAGMERDQEDGAGNGGKKPPPEGENPDGGEESGDQEGEEPDGGEPVFTLTFPAEHAEAWFRTMNQARLVLSARWGISSEQPPDPAQLIATGGIEHWFQYEMFGVIQGWLVERVLDAD